MALTVLRDRVKEKCGVPDASLDAVIDRLIAEVVPILEAGLQPAFVADAAVRPTLELGATELVCAELLDQIAREPGATEGIVLMGFESFGGKLREDADRLRAAAEARLGPYRVRPSRVRAISLPEGFGMEDVG